MCFFFFVLFFMYWRWNVNIFVFLQLEILKQRNKETETNTGVRAACRGADRGRCCLLSACRQIRVQPSGSAADVWVLVLLLTLSCTPTRLHVHFLRRQTSFFSLDTATSEKLRVWMKRAPPAVCFSWLDSDKRKKNNTNKWVGSERPGESQHRDYMNNLCVTWHEDNNAVVLITPAGGEVSITVIRTRKAAWVFVFLRWTGACWICMFGLNAGYVLSVALVGSQHSSKWHWRGIREQRWKYISEKKHSGADTTRPFTLFKSLKCVSVRPMSKKGVIIVVINCGAG